jgi:small multidrug resistance pump
MAALAATEAAPMNWLMLSAAIAFEVVGTTSLKLSEGMTRPGWFVLCLMLYATSFALLGISLKAIPVGVAYAIWSGVGTVLIALIGILWFHESAGPVRLLFIAMILIGAIGLNLTTRSH